MDSIQSLLLNGALLLHLIAIAISLLLLILSFRKGNFYFKIDLKNKHLEFKKYEDDDTRPEKETKVKK